MLIVSIHAPARGATQFEPVRIVLDKFQSTPPHGERQAAPAPLFSFVLFQSTPPHGERPPLPDSDAALSLFQSTPPHGERLLVLPCVGMLPTFQSTPPHGERLFGVVTEDDDFAVSIHAPARGATHPQDLQVLV